MSTYLIEKSDDRYLLTKSEESVASILDAGVDKVYLINKQKNGKLALRPAKLGAEETVTRRSIEA